MSRWLSLGNYIMGMTNLALYLWHGHSNFSLFISVSCFVLCLLPDRK
jgi:hypothetical protein